MTPQNTTHPDMTIPETKVPGGRATGLLDYGGPAGLGRDGPRYATRPASGERGAVSVDNTRCQVYGFCGQEAPQVFQLGPDGRLRYDPRPPAAHRWAPPWARWSPTCTATPGSGCGWAPR
jgi:hypothetical protein